MPSRVIRCGLLRIIKVVAPRQRRVFGRQHRMFVPVKNAVAVFLRTVAAFDELLRAFAPSRFSFLLNSVFVMGSQM